MSDKNKFDWTAYNKEYHKKHYQNVSVVFKHEEGDALTQAANEAGVSKSAYIKQAVKEKIAREK